MIEAAAHRSTSLDLVELVKPRIMVMALLTAAGGMSLAPGAPNTDTALLLVLGCALIVGAANTMNMYLERDIDCLMARTMKRPLPQKRLAPNVALVFGVALGALALPVLFLVNGLTALLGAIAFIAYVGMYTPLKPRTHWATWIGAVPGAMPALMGWTAATGSIDVRGLAVFAILFIWQIPHFHAIALFRQKEYDRAGLKTLPGTHGDGAARGQIVSWLVVQVALSLELVPLGVCGGLYLATAIVLGALVLGQALPGLWKGDARWAKRVFLLSIVYLPVLFTVMVLDGRM
ncbi:MAG TPA: heme o synthase [Kofleriaceae bacterium]|nr:heme o synthase [Kofleriaceae bacterium]